MLPNPNATGGIVLDRLCGLSLRPETLMSNNRTGIPSSPRVDKRYNIYARRATPL